MLKQYRGFDFFFSAFFFFPYRADEVNWHLLGCFELRKSDHKCLFVSLLKDICGKQRNGLRAQNNLFL